MFSPQAWPDQPARCRRVVRSGPPGRWWSKKLFRCMSCAWRPAAFWIRLSTRNAPAPCAARRLLTRHRTAPRSLLADAVEALAPAPEQPDADAVEAVPRASTAAVVNAADESRPRVQRMR